MAGWVVKRGEIWHIGFHYKGTEYRISAKTSKKREAEKILAYIWLNALGTSSVVSSRKRV